MEVPRPHRVSLHTTGPLHATNFRAICLPGRRNSRKSKRKARVRTIWTRTMENSARRAIRVASAAPVTPRAGAPSLPKISTQFKKVLIPMEAARMYIPSRGRSMLRHAARYTRVIPLNT